MTGLFLLTSELELFHSPSCFVRFLEFFRACISDKAYKECRQQRFAHTCNPT